MKQFNALIFRPASWFIILLTASFAFRLLKFPKAWDVTVLDYDLKTILSKVLTLIIALTFTWVLLRVIDFISIILRDRAELTESKMDDQLVPFIKDLLKIIVVLISIGIMLATLK